MVELPLRQSLLQEVHFLSAQKRNSYFMRGRTIRPRASVMWALQQLFNGEGVMSLRNFHVNANVTDAELSAKAKELFDNIVGSFRQAAANGRFSFGPITLSDGDLNRVHSIVTEVDSRRLFYACGEDESPQYAMQSLYEARRAIMQESKGVWANPSCEVLVQDILATLSEYCTAAEKLSNAGGNVWSPERVQFMMLMTDMRLKIWLLVASLKKKLGSVIRPRNLPLDVENIVMSGGV